MIRLYSLAKRYSWVIILVALFCAFGAIGNGFRFISTKMSRPVPQTHLPPTAPATRPGKVVGLPVNLGDPVLVTLDNSDSRWKGVSVAAWNEAGATRFDMGMAYELAKWRTPEFKVLGIMGPKIRLPEVSGDVMVTPSRVGVGLGLELNEYLDAVGGIQRTWQGENGYYAGVGFHYRW